MSDIHVNRWTPAAACKASESAMGAALSPISPLSDNVPPSRDNHAEDANAADICRR